MAYETAEALIRQERRRQVKVEGWSPAHDAEYLKGELFSAARCYHNHAVHDGNIAFRANGIPLNWPWADEWWKPRNKQRDLERAGALCLAELERSCGEPPAYGIRVNEQLRAITVALDAIL